MDKTTSLGLAAAISALVALPAAGADAQSQPAVPRAQSVAELLDPIPDAGARLQLADLQEAAQQPRLIEAQYVPVPVPMGHHHHHHWRRRWRRHHHHHHHSND